MVSTLQPLRDVMLEVLSFMFERSRQEYAATALLPAAFSRYQARTRARTDSDKDKSSLDNAQHQWCQSAHTHVDLRTMC